MEKRTKKKRVKYTWYKPTYLSRKDECWQRRFQALEQDYKAVNSTIPRMRDTHPELLEIEHHVNVENIPDARALERYFERIADCV